MNVDAVKKSLKGIANKHRITLSSFGRRQSQLLEIAGLMTAAQHYKAHNYAVTPENLGPARVFKLKLDTRSSPRNYSHFVVRAPSTGVALFEIYSNLAVKGHYGTDGGRYVVDVGVVRAGSVPLWTATASVASKDLITFAEVKNLVVYPMLLAQFIGIVHEIKPRFLGGRVPPGFRRDHHFLPALIAVGTLRATSSDIVKAFPARKFRLKVCDDLDGFITRRGWHRLDASALT